MAADFLRLFPGLEFGRALDGLWEFIGLLNRYIVTAAPWELAKRPEAAAGWIRSSTTCWKDCAGSRRCSGRSCPAAP